MSWDTGFVREPGGALALSESTEGTWHSGFLRDPDGKLVVSGGGSGLSEAEVKKIAEEDGIAAHGVGVSLYDAETETWEARPTCKRCEFVSTVKEPKKPAEGVMQTGDELIEPSA